MKNWTIKKRIVIGFGTALLLVAGQAALTLFLLREVRSASTYIATNAVPGTATAVKVARQNAEAQIHVLRVLQSTPTEDLRAETNEISAIQAEIIQLLAGDEKTMTTEKDKRIFEQLGGVRTTYVPIPIARLAAASSSSRR